MLFWFSNLQETQKYLLDLYDIKIFKACGSYLNASTPTVVGLNKHARVKSKYVFRPNFFQYV